MRASFVQSKPDRTKGPRFVGAPSPDATAKG